MSGVLLYTKDEARRNAFAVDKFKKALGVTLEDESYRGVADFVINRTDDYRAGKYYEDRGIRVFNPSSLSRLANDKQLCYEYVSAHGIPIMPINYASVPAVKKKRDGKGGKEVFMLEAAEAFDSAYVYQKPCDTPGRDLRVWVIGGEIVCSVLRSSDADFRSNFSLGGSARQYELSSGETALVKKVISLFPADYIGIDFLFDGGGLVFNEVEDAVGARTVYACTKLDIIELYCDYIKRTLALRNRRRKE